jgi:hypothetical protein
VGHVVAMRISIQTLLGMQHAAPMEFLQIMILSIKFILNVVLLAKSIQTVLGKQDVVRVRSIKPAVVTAYVVIVLPL